MKSILRLHTLVALCILLLAGTASAQFKPTDVAGVQLWLAADSGITKNGSNEVSQWDDLSGNANHATQGNGTLQPLFVDSIPALNNMPAVRFDKDFMSFPGLTDIRSVFVLMNHETGVTSSGTSPFLGHTSATDFYSDGTNVVGSFASNNVKNGTGAVNGAAVAPTAIQKSTDYSIITLVTLGNTQADQLTKDRGFNFYWEGDFVELIIYNTVLTDAEQDSVETYLFNKFAPPVALGPDINQTYGFCDVALDAGAHFASYAWSNGDSVATVNINQPGTYWVDVVDAFGRASSDTVVVNITSAPASFADSVVCIGDTLVWNAGLANAGHTFTWSNASTDSLLEIATGGDVYLQVDDTVGCSFFTDTFNIELDTFELLMTLGPDTNLCSGNNIALKAGGAQAVGYAWSTGSSANMIPITTTGTYTVTATDGNGCVGVDSLLVTIIGAAPLIDFDLNAPCFGDSTYFVDQTVPVGNGLQSWNWTFGDGGTDTVPDPVHYYAGSDTAYTATLTVMDSAGCGAVLSQTANVVQPATLGISFPTPSASSAVVFTPSMQFTLADGLDSIQWSFGNGDSSVVPVPSQTYSSSGVFLVDYQVFTDSGCTYTFDTVITVFDSAAVYAPVTLVSPSNGLTTSEVDLDFVWDALNQPGAIYDIEVATDSAFSNVLANAQALTTNTFSVTGLPTDTIIYWRVRAFAGTSFSEFSAIWSVRIFSPGNVPGMLLWYKGDAGTIVSGGDSLVTWHDQSGNGNHANQVDAAEQPMVADSIALLNYHTVARFDGVDDFMEFTNVATIRSVFFVMNWTGPVPGVGTFPTLGHASTFDFFSSGDNVVASFANSDLKNGDGWLNTAPVAPDAMALPVDYSILSFASLGDLQAERITYDRNIAGSVWQGDYAEIMLFDNVLDSVDREEVENYLRNKYAPPVNLGPDVLVNYGFCPETLNAESRFVNYAWSTGDTTATIDVSATGDYSVTTTDVFGFVSSDTIRVVYPYLPSVDTLICFGDTAWWDPGVDTSAYTLIWSNGFAGSIIPMTVAADYYLTINDTTFCSFDSDTIILSVDSFPAVVSLGADTNLCRFNSIALLAGASQAQTYVWSNGETTPTLTIDSAATYSVIATDSIGCNGFDTVAVALIGEAPQVSFAAASTCFGDSTTFTNTSQAPNGLQTAWKWHFGDGDSSSVENPTHLYVDSLSLYSISLTVADSSGCENTATQNVVVIQVPDLFVEYPFPIFVDSTVTYDFSSNFDAGDDAASVFWDFGDGDSVYVNPANHIYTSPISFTIDLEITSDSGCVTSIDTTILVLDPTPIYDPVTLVAPLNGMINDATAYSFEWNAAQQPNAAYHFQISDSPVFNSIVAEQYMLDTTIVPISGLTSGQNYFWRVRYYDGAVFSAYSDVWSFTVYDPTSVPGALLWYAANNGVIANAGDSVSQWNDISGNGNHATQVGLAEQPLWVDDITLLNHHPVVRFDGVDDYMEFAEEDSIRSVFFVFKHATGTPTPGTFPTLGHASEFDFFASGTSVFSQPPPSNVTTGTAYENKVQVAASLVEIPVDYTLLTLETVGPAQAERITRDRNFPGNVWEGDFAEIILLDQVLPSGNREQLQDYLHFKYAPPVNLGPDINITYGFCPVTLDAGDRFASYLWSDSSTASTLVVNGTGDYVVTVTDVFGFVSMDSVSVRFPVNLQGDSLICIGDSVVWNTGLDTANYSIAWNTGSTDSLLVMNTQGFYGFLATDSNLCSFSSDSMFLTVDSFSVIATLGPDIDLCAGNTIELAAGAADVVSYLWNDSTTASDLVVDTSGIYFVHVADSNSCSVTDTVVVSVLGEAPNVEFFGTSLCLGDSTFFTDTTMPPTGANIVTWHWAFGDGDTSALSQPAHLFGGTADYDVTLTLTTDSGCVGSATQEFTVNPKPVVAITSSLACNASETSFTDQSTFADSTWAWNFGDPTSGTANTDTNQNPLHVFATIGTYPVTLVVANTFGCIDSATNNVQVFVSPGADFDATETCVGDSTLFTEDANGFNLTYNWNINGQNVSNAATSVSYLFPSAGNYLATLTVVDGIGCTGSFTDTVRVHAHPTAAYSNTLACPGTPFQFMDASVPGGGVITDWDWRIFPVDTFSVQNPEILIASPGSYQVVLRIADQYGCEDSLQNTFTLDELPSASFNFNPKFGTPPLNVNFENASSVDSVFWNFGTGDTALVFEPSYTYLDTGVFDITLYAFNDDGCVDSLVRPIQVRDPLIDVAIENVTLVENGDYLVIQASIVNLGSVELNSVDITARFNSIPAIRETWEGVLPSGGSVPYQFTASIQETTALDLVCVAVGNPNVDLEDEVPGNNEQCIPVATGFALLAPYPNPVNDVITLQMVVPDDGDAEIYLYDDIGQLVRVIWRGTLNEGVQTVTLPVAELRNGTYGLKVYYNRLEEVVRFVKVRQ